MGYVVQTAEDVLSGLFRFQPCFFLMLFCGLKKRQLLVTNLGCGAK